MAIPERFAGRLSVPVVAAPMFLISGPDLVVECCRSGIVGTFPALNQRTTAAYAEWLSQVRARLDTAAREDGVEPAPFGINLVAHRSNARLATDLDATLAARVPLVITSLGLDRGLIRAVQQNGSLVFHDVTTTAHARKAAEAGVDGLIVVCHGAGGHAGQLNPLVAVSEIRKFYSGTLLVAGGITSGDQVAAMCLVGADMCYVGTRFMATQESLGPAALKSMLLAASCEDIVLTPAISGVPGNFLRPSIVAAGRNPDDFTPPSAHDFGTGEAKAWKDIWAAGQGVGGINDIPSARTICQRLSREYRAAVNKSSDLANLI